MQHKEDLTKGNLWKQMLIFSLPLMLSNVLQVLFNLSDVAVVGKFAGDQALGSVGSTTTLITLFIGLVMGVGNAVNVLCANSIGAHDITRYKKIVHNAIIICLSFGLVVGILGIIFSKELLLILSTKESLLDGASNYLRVYLIGLPALALYNYGTAIYSSLGDTKKPLIILIIAGILNVGLNFLFVVGFKLDVIGVGLASAISQYFSAIFVLILLFTRKDEYRLKLKEIKYSGKETIKLLSIGIPGALQYSIFAIANLFVQLGVNSFDDIVVKGNSAALNYDTLTFELMAAFYMACATFAGQAYGSCDHKRVLKSFFVSLVYSFGLGFIFGIFLFFFSDFALSIFTNSQEVIDAGVNRLKIMAFSYCVSAFMDVPIACNRGLGRTIMPIAIEIFGACFIRILWVYTIFQAFHTIEVLYLVFIVTWVITSTLEIIYFAIIYKRLKKNMTFNH